MGRMLFYYDPSQDNTMTPIKKPNNQKIKIQVDEDGVVSGEGHKVFM